MAIKHAQESIDIPNLDFLSVLFGSNPCYTTEDRVIHAEADDPRISYTKAQARIWTKRLAFLLRHEYGIGKNGPGKDNVAVFSTGQTGVPIAFYGIVAAGGVYSAASPAYQPNELARMVNNGPCSLLLCSEDLLDTAKLAAKEAKLALEHVIVLSSRPQLNLRTALGKVIPIPTSELDWQRITDPDVLSKTTLALLYSSGTTGLPKGVILTHQNIVAAGTPVTVALNQWDKDQQAQGKEPYNYTTIGHLPMSHIAGTQTCLVNISMSNGTVYWMQRFDFPKFLEYSKRYQISFLMTVPPIYLLMLKSPAVTDQLAKVRFAITGAAPMGMEVQKAVSKKFGATLGGNIYLKQTWGLTETTGSSTWVPWNKDDYSGGVGWIFPNGKARVVDDNNQDVPEGSQGEIWIRGPFVSPGYHNNPEATKEGFFEGWCRTGDIGYFRDERLFIVDRKKELIKYKGNQVAPAELEALLLTHPKISDAAVIGVEGEGTELPRAYIVADRSKINEQEIKDFVKKNLSSYKQLRGGVRFIDAVPKNPSGKILRKDLRILAKDEAKSKL